MFARFCLICSILLLSTISAQSVLAVSASAPPPSDAAKQNQLETKDSWSRFIAKSGTTLHKGVPGTPGRILGDESSSVSQDQVKIFSWGWRYRPQVYEIHYAAMRELAKSVYGLALHAQDIDAKTNFSRFNQLAQSCHYSMTQVCDWINDVFAGKFKSFSPEETLLVGMLVQDGALRVENGKFVPVGLISWMLAASASRRQGFDQGLQHQRLHIFWQENAEFRAEAERRWKALSPEESIAIRKSLEAFGNEEARIIEEWAVQEAESGHISPDQPEKK